MSLSDELFHLITYKCPEGGYTGSQTHTGFGQKQSLEYRHTPGLKSKQYDAVVEKLLMHS